ncbi:MAG: argininosuccinate lyase [Ignavibacterium sp.]
MLWGSRFSQQINKDALKFSSSLNFDINLIEEDIECSKAHSEMLMKINILTDDEFKKIFDGLNLIKEEWESGIWTPNKDEEDIHSAIESRLKELIGITAEKLHTGRSRNDQVATDLRLWIKKQTTKIKLQIIDLQKTILKISEENIETIIPGYTHLQRAQPISLAFHFLAYIEMLERDNERVSFVFDESDVSPLGSGALAGSTLPLDRNFTAAKLNFKNVSRNALDSVSDRDFAIDFLNLCVIGMMHLSRLSEELILWSTSEWNFIKIGDSFSTGSSLMPQKKNPDIAELIRGKIGRVIGNYQSLLVVLKGLPLSYNRDLQEDKELIFDSFNTYSNSLIIINQMLSSIGFNKTRFVKELEGDYSLATDVSDWLVLNGIPFREAHKIVGKLVNYAESNQKKLNQLTTEEIKTINPIFNEEVLSLFKIETALSRKQTFGSPNPNYVKNEIKKWKSKIS